MTSVDTLDAAGPASETPVPRPLTIVRTGPDRIYRGVTRAAGLTTFLVLFLVGLFLFLKGWPAFRSQHLSFLTNETWDTVGAHPKFGVAAVLYGTVEIALIALVIGAPFAIATALCINEYLPAVLKRPLTSLVDLLAAIPSVIYGFWGIFFLQNNLVGLARWLTHHLGWIPIFSTKEALYTSSAFVAGVVVGIMIVPIITSICREVFSLAPVGEREGAMALGATKWDMIRTVILPFGRGGLVGAVLLGLGRALGETIAIVLIISPTFIISGHILQAGANTVSALITDRFATGGKLGAAGLLAAAFTLFVLTLALNLVAARIVNRSRSAKGVEL